MAPRIRAHLPRVVPFFVLVTLAGCASLRGGEDRLMEVAEVAARSEVAVDGVWPGFRPFERGFIVFNAGGPALLVADPAVVPPAPWALVPTENERLRGRLYRRTTPLPGLTGGVDPEYAVGERRYTAVEVDRALQQSLATLYHESFHAWQREAFAPLRLEVLAAEAVTPEQVAGSELERRILAAAIRSSGPESDSLVAAFLAARRHRYVSLSDSARAIERSLETKEGTAHLLGYQAARAALALEDARVDSVIVRTLEMNLSERGRNPLTRYRWRAYGTGSAISLLLDRLGVAWRAEVAAGAPLDSLLSLHARVLPDDALRVTALDRFGHADLLRAAERDHVPMADDPIGAFLNAAPYQLVLEMQTPPEFDASISFDPGDGGFTNPHPRATLLHAPRRASLVSNAIELTSRNRPIMMDARTERLMRVVVMLPGPVRIDGTAPSPRSGPVDGTVTIRGGDTEVTVRGERLVSITVADDAVTIRVRED